MTTSVSHAIPISWRDDKLRDGIAWYLKEIGEDASPEALEWWRSVEKYRTTRSVLWDRSRNRQHSRSDERQHPVSGSKRILEVVYFAVLFRGRAVTGE